MMKKRMTAILLALLLTVALIPATVRTASADIVTGQCGDSLAWSLDTETGKLTVTGSGDMWDYTMMNEYHDVIRSIELPAGLTGIGDSAFLNCSQVTAVTIPDGVKTVGRYAFSGCSGLKTIIMTASVTGIKEGAFCGCTSLYAVRYDGSVADLDQMVVENTDHNNDPLLNAIWYCTSAQCGANLFWSFNEETGVLTITGTGAMYGFHDYRAPWYENTPYILRVDLPDGLTAIGDNAFCDCTLLTELTVPEGVVRIGMAAFGDCTALTKITLPKSLKEIEAGAFDGAALTDVYYYGSVADLDQMTIKNTLNAPLLGATWHFLSPQCGENLFWSFDADTGVLTITGTGAMYGFFEDNAPWYDDRESITAVVLPDGLANVSGGAFRDCAALEEIALPRGVKRIGMAAFLNCAKLTKITLPNSLEEVETGAFDGAGLTDVYYYGTETDREGIAIDNSANGNAPLLGAAWHYLPDVTLVWNANDVQFRGTTPYMVYRGSPCTPRFTLQFAGGETLGAAYYDFEYRENDRAGTGYVFVTFRNGYEGTLRGWFKIYLPATETTAVQNVDNGIALSWSAVPGAAGYVIYRRAWNATADGWTPFVRWNNTTGLNWTDEKVYAGTRYQYGIKAYFARRLDPVSGDMIGGNVGDNYNLGEVGPIRTMMRITTRTLRSVTGGTKQITAKWSPSALFAGYELQLATNAAFTQNVKTVQIKDPKAASKTVKNLKAKTTYYVRVRSFHVFENVTYYGAWSNVGSAKTK